MAKNINQTQQNTSITLEKGRRMFDLNVSLNVVNRVALHVAPALQIQIAMV